MLLRDNLVDILDGLIMEFVQSGLEEEALSKFCTTIDNEVIYKEDQLRTKLKRVMIDSCNLKKADGNCGDCTGCVYDYDNKETVEQIIHILNQL